VPLSFHLGFLDPERALKAGPPPWRPAFFAFYLHDNTDTNTLDSHSWRMIHAN